MHSYYSSYSQQLRTTLISSKKLQNMPSIFFLDLMHWSRKPRGSINHMTTWGGAVSPNQPYLIPHPIFTLLLTPAAVGVSPVALGFHAGICMSIQSECTKRWAPVLSCWVYGDDWHRVLGRQVITADAAERVGQARVSWGLAERRTRTFLPEEKRMQLQ